MLWASPSVNVTELDPITTKKANSSADLAQPGVVPDTSIQEASPRFLLITGGSELGTGRQHSSEGVWSAARAWQHENKCKEKGHTWAEFLPAPPSAQGVWLQETLVTTATKPIKPWHLHFSSMCCIMKEILTLGCSHFEASLRWKLKWHDILSPFHSLLPTWLCPVI